MSKLAELDQALHHHFLQYQPYRDLTLVSRAIQLKGSWMYNKRLVIVFSSSDRLWYWKLNDADEREAREKIYTDHEGIEL